MPQSYTRGTTVPVRPGRKPRWAAELKHLEADHVILDLGAGTLPATLDLFLMADLGVCVTTPEPPSIEATYRFAKALFVRRLRRSLIRDRFKVRLVERAQADLEPLPSPQTLVRTVARYDARLGEVAARELSRIRPRLVVNCVRLKPDTDLGPAVVDMAKRYLGVDFDYAGHVEDDDSVWLSVTKRQPLLINNPASKSARNLERIARRLSALANSPDQSRNAQPISLVAEEPTLYDVLFTHRGASDEELRRAYRRQRDIYRSDSLALSSLLGDGDLAAEQARMEEAHDTLLDTLKRRSYDLSTFPDLPEQRPARNPERDAALEAERAMLREELSREISAETIFSGPLLKKVRESQGVALSDISNWTKISRSHLEAIEEERFETLPASVYLRGFLKQVALYLKLDPAAVMRTYLARHRAWRKRHEGDA